MATTVASTCDYAPTTSPTSPTGGPWSTSFHATNHATPAARASRGSNGRLSGAARWSATYGVGSSGVWSGGGLQDRHLMEQPMLGRCGSGTGSPASTREIAAPRSAPVTGLPLPGVDSSNAPR